MESEDMQVSERLCPTRIIDDAPAEDDLLAFHGEIGPHRRVAKAIVDVIQSSDESGGKMIGLEGGWGAGKTTVVNMIRKLLVGREDISVFTFDAWAHEGDPLRRTYLESLIRHFQSLKWVEIKKWDNILEELAKRRRITNKRTVPKTTTLGKLFAISVFLVPVGVPFLARALEQGVTIAPDRPIAWMFMIGLILTLSPFIVLAGNLIRVFWKRLHKNKKEEPTDKQSDDGKEVSEWSFLMGNAITEVKQDTTETPDPTSIEFEDKFCELMQAALPEDSNRQVVMVLDNLDRSDPNSALSIWATLQTFLQHRGIDIKPWFSRLWILVPFDPVGLRRLWVQRDVTQEEKVVDNSKSVNQFVDCVVSDSFIDKSFTLRFEVPPTVLSNWKAYLSHLVEQALPEHLQEDRHTIFRVFSHIRTKDGEAPSPRELKLYVNQIGAIHRQWQHEFPIGHIAYYVLLRKMHKRVREGLYTKEIPDPSIEAILPPDLRANLAGLAFNVKAPLGEQLLLSDPIHDLLSRGDYVRLRELEQLYQDGFWTVLEQVVAERLVDDSAERVANAALCIEKAEILKEQSRSEVNTITNGIRRAATSVKKWFPFDENVADGIASACRLVSDPPTSNRIIENLRHTIKDPGEKTEPKVVTDVLIKGVVHICAELRKLGHEDALSTPFTLPLDAENWIDICPLIAEQESSFWPMFMPQAKFADISNSLRQKLDDESLAHVLPTLKVTQATPMRCDWTILVEDFEERLGTSMSSDSEKATVFLEGLSLLRRFDCDEADVALKRLVDDGDMTHNLYVAHSQKDTKTVARCLIVFLEQRPGAEKPNVAGKSEAGYKILSELLDTDDTVLGKLIVQTLIDEDNLGLLLRVINTREHFDPLIIRCLRIIADGDTPEVLYTTPVVIDMWVDLVDLLDEEEPIVKRFNKLIEHLCQNLSLIEEVQEAGFQHDNVGLYLIISRNFLSTSFMKWCRDGLQALDASTWESELNEEEDALALLLEIQDAGTAIELRQAFQDAVVKHAISVLMGSVVPSDNLISLKTKVLDALSEAAHTILRNRLRDAAIDQNGKCADRFFDIYGDEITDANTLTNSKATVSGLFSPLVREKSVGGLRWLNGVLSNEPNILDNFKDKAATKDFLERLESEPVLGEGEAHELITELASKLGIELSEEPAEEEGPTAADTPEIVNDEENPEKE